MSDDKRISSGQFADDPEHVLADGAEGPRDATRDSVTINSDDTLDGIVIPPCPHAIDEPVAEPGHPFGVAPAPRVLEELPAVRRRRRRRALEMELAVMIAANDDARPAGVYSGFHLVCTGGEPLASEQSYVGTFLPLRTARKFPELLAFESVAYNSAHCDEILPVGTRIIIRPGLFYELCVDVEDEASVWTSPLATAGYALLAALVTGLAIWLRR
ncbi:MAG TPA: hypothetical protein VGM05_24215 [Planctomycetaceae bacterium]|jgi:hypothetical protein